MIEPVPEDAAAKAEALAADGNIEEAFRILTSAVAAGDAQAAATLGNWRMSGDLIRRDIRMARELFGRAANLGLDAADGCYTALLASGAGGQERRWPEALDRLRRRASRDPVARVQLAMLSMMALTEAGDPARLPELRSVSERQPWVAIIDGFMTPRECLYVSLLAEPLLQPSVVVHPRTGEMMRDPIRSSTAAVFPFLSEDLVLHALNRRIAAATRTTYEQGEPLQVLSYHPGQEYKLHSDALPHDPNPRITTLLVYLNQDYRGGETEFPRAGIRFRGRPGDALVFGSVNHDGRPDPAAWHAGLPVAAGRKLILSKWIRSRPLDLAGPGGRPF